MAEKDQIIKFTGESGEEIEFRVLEQTKLNGNTYLLVLDIMEGEEDEALILKEVSTDGKDEITYEILEDDEEIKAIAGVFEGLLDDIQLV
ncbi:MAG: DUF1292 domain-containing protein [Lachnospiraceae bacterium]|nr:DUF1292 domain-containing protein [Lachnospiraceae bacterium]